MKRMTMAAHFAFSAVLLSGAVLAQTAPAPATPAASVAAADAPTVSLWSRLWRTPDQRGQALLQQGDVVAAEQTFVDPQRKGHAALQAQDYAGAAKTLSGINTAEAQYNRGNALAHTGDLQAAMDAYDAALKRNPQHTDARHNRDVVAAALKKQKEEKKDSSKQDKQDKQESQDKKSKEDDKAGGKPEEKPDGKNGKPDAKPDDGKDGKDGKPGQTPPGKTAEQAASAPKPGQASAPAAPASSPKDDAAQARRDAESALGKGAQPPAMPQGGASVPAPGPQGAADAVKLPLTEKQMAKEQWLRAIPDDPGGLLRRKFLIEHMLRQQGQKP